MASRSGPPSPAAPSPRTSARRCSTTSTTAAATAEGAGINSARPDGKLRTAVFQDVTGVLWIEDGTCGLLIHVIQIGDDQQEHVGARFQTPIRQPFPSWVVLF